MKVIAKCTNYAGCLVAYRGEKIELSDGAPLVCPECGKPISAVKGGSAALIKIAAIVAAVVAIAAVAFFGVRAIANRKATPAKTADTETIVPDLSPSDTASNPPPPPTTGTPNETPSDTTPTPVDTTPPKPATTDNTPVTADVREEVLMRIDLMPNIPAEKKDKLINAVRRARDMRRVVVIPFSSGQASPSAAGQANLKTLMASAEVMKFRDDLTAVFVVLGFADSQGDEKKSFVISGNRAKSVKDFMIGGCGVKNVTHDVAMGASKLLDDQKLAKNRVCEIWAVLP